MMTEWLGWSAVGTGFLAALLWLVASVVRVRSDKYIARLRARGEIGLNETPAQITSGPYDLLESLKASARWNAWAAACTALSVLLQATANFLSPTG